MTQLIESGELNNSTISRVLVNFLDKQSILNPLHALLISTYLFSTKTLEVTDVDHREGQGAGMRAETCQVELGDRRRGILARGPGSGQGEIETDKRGICASVFWSFHP